jgi:hypothetical protein
MMAFALAAAAGDLSQDEGRIVMQNFASCMADVRNRNAQAFLALDPATPLNVQTKLLHPACLPVKASARMPTSLTMHARMQHYRYAMAEALLLRANRRSTPVIAATAPRLDHSMIAAGAPAPANWVGGLSTWPAEISRSHQDARLSAFGECVVRASPDQSWALLKSDVASKAETAVFTALTPTLARCLAQDRSVQLGKFNVRGAVALNYYRLSQIPRAWAGGAR